MPDRQRTRRATGGSADARGRGEVVVACASLRDTNAPLAEWLGDLDVGCTFCGDVYSAAETYDPRLALLPVLTEAQAQRLGRLMERCPGTSVLGIVMDVTGHHTHRAIQNGASWVLNTLLPAACCRNLLRMVIQAVVLGPTVPEPLVAEPPVPEGVEPPTRPGTARAEPPAEARKVADAQEEELLALLCGPDSIAEIARRFYCSERSMYRQLRDLYRSYGVTGRRELRRVIALRSVTRHQETLSTHLLAPPRPAGRGGLSC
uniref:Putative DNA-binding protein n=1 Tax=Microbispora corallina TaxID=83302 RepID=E2IHB3_9ACTN|nr:putative DNA-binding protein [Microbispora corallina]